MAVSARLRSQLLRRADVFAPERLRRVLRVNGITMDGRDGLALLYTGRGNIDAAVAHDGSALEDGDGLRFVGRCLPAEAFFLLARPQAQTDQETQVRARVAVRSDLLNAEPGEHAVVGEGQRVAQVGGRRQLQFDQLAQAVQFARVVPDRGIARPQV